MTAPTTKQLRALGILAEHGPLAPKRFAKLMWPDAKGWMHPTRSGPSGTHRGGIMYLTAGGFLAKLRRAGLARLDRKRLGMTVETSISAEGRSVLRAEEIKSVTSKNLVPTEESP